MTTDDISSSNDDLVRNISNSNENKDKNPNILLYLAGLVMKPIRGMKSLMNVITYAIWLVYNVYMFVTDPFGLKRRVKKFVIEKAMRIVRLVWARVSPSIREWLKENKVMWNLGLKCGWGFLWLIYVCVVLVGLLVAALVMGRLVIRGVVQEPMRVDEVLSFDYGEKSPVAYAQLLDSSGAEVGKVSGARVIPVNHKLQVTVSLNLPESDYNRNLGMFQVKVDFLAADGRVLSTSRRPCMLQFKSSTIRFLSTFLHVAPLLTGYASESQNVNIKFRGFTEGKTPTACIRVIMEPRAEFQHGAGIPEIYSASLTLESEFSLLKRSIWYWKSILFVWISITMFIIELLFVLLCCKPIITPKVKLR